MKASMLKYFSLSVALTLSFLMPAPTPAQAGNTKTVKGHDEQQLAEAPPVTWQSTPVNESDDPRCPFLETYTITLNGNRMKIERGVTFGVKTFPLNIDLDLSKGVLENGYWVVSAPRNANGLAKIFYFEPSELNRGNVPKTFRLKHQDKSCVQLYKPN
jgi:hypothetical protein